MTLTNMFIILHCQIHMKSVPLSCVHFVHMSGVFWSYKIIDAFLPASHMFALTIYTGAHSWMQNRFPLFGGNTYLYVALSI